MTNCHLTGGAIRYAPLKRVIVDDEGIMRAVWWKGNEALKHLPLETTVDTETAKGPITLLKETFPVEDGVLFEGQIDPAENERDALRGVYFDVSEGDGFAFALRRDRIEFGKLHGSGNPNENELSSLENQIPFPKGWSAKPNVPMPTSLDRGIEFCNGTKVRVLAKEDCMEVYCNDHMMLIQRIPGWNGRIGLLQPVGKDLVKILRAYSAGSPSAK
jgi:hypothetical protein